MIVSSTSTSTYPAPRRPVPARMRQQPGEPGQRDQEPRGDRVELADVAEGERPQERPQRRGRVRPGEDPAHPAVPQQRHVIDRVRAGDHPGDQRGDLQPGVRALVGRHLRCSSASVPQPGRLGQRQHRDQPGRRHEIRIIERPPTSPAACERVASQRCPSGSGDWTCRKSQSPSTAGHSRRYGTLTDHQLIGGSGLSGWKDASSRSPASHRPARRTPFEPQRRL